MATANSTVPQSLKPVFDAVVASTDSVCSDRLDRDYRDLARRMVAALCRKRPSPLVSGQPRTWAAGVVYTLGQINFLMDPHSRPHMTTADLATAFGVGQSTIHAKARVIQQALKTDRLSADWLLPSRIDDHPLVWMAEVNGFVVDLRRMPREVQEIALAKGLIPRLPGERE